MTEGKSFYSACFFKLYSRKSSPVFRKTQPVFVGIHRNRNTLCVETSPERGVYYIIVSIFTDNIFPWNSFIKDHDSMFRSIHGILYNFFCFFLTAEDPESVFQNDCGKRHCFFKLVILILRQIPLTVKVIDDIRNFVSRSAIIRIIKRFNKTLFKFLSIFRKKIFPEFSP